MAKSWYLMTRPLFNSGFEKEEFEAYAQDGFEELLDSFLSTDIDLYKTNDLENGETIKAIVENVTSDSDYNDFIRQILTQIGILKSGYYVKYNNNFWLVRDIVDNNRIYEKAIMLYCNYSLKFISDVSQNIVTYPVYMKNATQYNSGEIPREQETIGSAKYLIYIMCDNETVKIDNGKRFLIDKNTDEPTSFEITQVDTVSYNYNKDLGVLRWTVVESQYNSKRDNKELMIADYYKNTSAESWI